MPQQTALDIVTELSTRKRRRHTGTAVQPPNGGLASPSISIRLCLRNRSRRGVTSMTFANDPIEKDEYRDLVEAVRIAFYRTALSGDPGSAIHEERVR